MTGLLPPYLAQGGRGKCGARYDATCGERHTRPGNTGIIITNIVISMVFTTEGCIDLTGILLRGAVAGGSVGCEGRTSPTRNLWCGADARKVCWTPRAGSVGQAVQGQVWKVWGRVRHHCWLVLRSQAPLHAASLP